MARGRMISKALGTGSEKFARLRIEHPAVGSFAQTLYMLLVVNSDDFGRQKGDAFTVKHSVWSTAPDDQATFERALEAMHAIGLIDRYTADGVSYLHVVQFDPHQQGLHKRTASQFPEPPGISRNVGNTSEIPSEPNLTEPKRTEPRAREDASVLLQRFEAFWSRYPRHEQREPACMLWREMAPSAAAADEILTSLEAHRLTKGWQDAIASNDLTFVPLAKNWLRDRRWLDVPSAGVPTAAPTTCKHRHRPPCVNDATCTSRYLTELDGVDSSAIEAVSA
jgi:hypothetical protein